MYLALIVGAVWVAGMPFAWILEDRSYRRWMERCFPLSWAQIQRGEYPMRNGIDHAARVWVTVVWPFALLTMLTIRKVQNG